MSPDIDEITLRRLVLTKRLYQHGIRHYHQKTDIDRFFSIHHFDNAIELLLKIIATYKGIDLQYKRDIGFKDLWNEINLKFEGEGSDFVLPLKRQIFLLHDKRNFSQHQGDLPSTETIIQCRAYSEDFITSCLTSVFSIDISDLHLSNIVTDEKIREHLLNSEVHLSNKEFKESMNESSIAMLYLQRKEMGKIGDRHDPLLHMRHFSGTRHRFAPHSFDRKIQKIYDEIIDYLTKRMGEQDEHLKQFINAVYELLKEELFLLKLGFDYNEFMYYQSISPKAYFNFGKSGAQVMGVREEKINEENAIFCYEFVLESAVRLQNLDELIIPEDS